VTLPRRYNLQIFFPPISAQPVSFPFYSLSLSRSFLFLVSPRAIHQRKSTGVLAFPFFGCSNELAVSHVASLPSFTPAPNLSFRLCPSLLLSWPVNLPFFAICEGVYSRYDSSVRRVAKRDRYLTYSLYSCLIYLAITLDAGSIAQLSVKLFWSLCFSSFQISHESHAIESHVIESS